LEGVEKLFLMTPPAQTFLGRSIAEQAKKSGVKHIVKLSALGAEEKDQTKFVWAAEHAQIEDFIKSLGIALTSLRPSCFMSNLYMDIDSMKKGGIYHGWGDEKLNLIATSEIGEVAAIALTEPGHEGKEYYITGADTLTGKEIAKVCSEVLGREITYHNVLDQQLREQAATFLPPQAIEPFSNMHNYFRNGGYNRSFDDFEKVTGKKPQSFRAWLEANKGAF